MEDREVKQLEKLGLVYLPGELPPWFYRIWLCIQTVALYKTALQKDIIKVFHKEAMSLYRPKIREILEPQQLGMSQTGAAKLGNVYTINVSTCKIANLCESYLVTSFTIFKFSAHFEVLRSPF